MKHLKPFLYAITFIFLVSNSGCKKYLEAPSDQNLLIITNLQDVQSLLDNYFKTNESNPGSDEVSADNYYLPDATYQSLPWEQNRNMYIWQPNDLFYPYSVVENDWTFAYNTIYIANTILDNMDGTISRTPENGRDWDDIKGQALFLRAHSFYKAVGIWALAYDEATASTDLGIPLRLNSDFNEPSSRSTNRETYYQIIQDLKMAIPLLPRTAIHSLRASKPAAYGLLARTYQAMRKFELAGLYADSCLQINHKLIDYNQLNNNSPYPLARFNDEVIYDARAGGGSSFYPINPAFCKIDTVLYDSYLSNDLRKSLFFTLNSAGITFRGSYFGDPSLFNGIATDEVYLIRAECYARAGNAVAAMTDLNTLLTNRYKTGTFQDITANNSEEALAEVLIERRKELIMRGNRWMDIKRLNKEGYNISIIRILDNVTYTLAPNDLRFALPIPDDVISLSGMQQNPR